MSTRINVIDLFAGPGGLGEGFSAFSPAGGKTKGFQIQMSVEKEVNAHKTLTLRALYRSISSAKDRRSYDDYVSGNIPKAELISDVAGGWDCAQQETLGGPTSLGDDNERIHKILRGLVKRHQGENWVVIGGPPCQAYSLAGRSRNKGIENYRPENDRRHFLYQEYLEILSIVEPDVFVMENVRGILTSKVEGKRIFPVIKEDLKNPSKAVSAKKAARSARQYKIYSFVVSPNHGDLIEINDLNDSDFIIRSEDYGVPQSRHRVILLGVASDISVVPGCLQPVSEKTPIERVLTGIPPLRSKLSRQADCAHQWKECVKKQFRMMRKEVRALGHIDVLHYMEGAISTLQSDLPIRVQSSYPRSGKTISKRLSKDLAEWLVNDPPPVWLNHEARGHMEADLGRYFFASSWAKAKSQAGSAPKALDFPACLAPKHANWDSGDFADRFRVQVSGRPATTITSHISKDGHYYIHYDPSQCRSLTVREAARIQTFPDNYFFEGGRTAQYVQVGNAVPPFLAQKIAKIVYDIIR